MDLNEVMDLNLWVSSASIVGFHAEYGWESDFHFCYFPDIIEENAINEKSCGQVLKHLIAKADAEIVDLEDDLAILQSQLSWAEDDEDGKLYELWCVAFKEKIKLLCKSLQTLKNGGAPSTHELNADSEISQPAERICDIISALLGQNFPTESKKGNCNSLSSDTEVRHKPTAASARLGLSGMPDEMKIIRTKNQCVTASFIGTRGLHIPDVRLMEKHELLKSTSERRQRSSTSLPGNHKVLDNDEQGGSFALQEAKSMKRSESMLFQLDCEAKDELALALKTHPLQSNDVEVDFDENEPLALVFNSQGSKRKKFQSNPTRSNGEILQEGNKKLCMNDISGGAASFEPSVVLKGSSRKVGIGRKSAVKKPSFHASENSDLNSGPARDTRSQFIVSTDINDSAMSSHSAKVQRDMNTVENHRQETSVSEHTRDELEKMKRGVLMSMAKDHGLKRYHKLKKSLIVDMITRQLG